MQSDQLPTLRGMECTSCRRIAFPEQEFGCEQCGAHGEDLAVAELSDSGRVLALLTLHEHPNQDLPVPAVIATIQLDDGPVLRARLLRDVEPGTRVAVIDDTNGLVFAEKGPNS